jgi:chemotaxis response regulator CheB
MKSICLWHNFNYRQSINKSKFIISVGASAGGLNALIEMVSHFPEEIDAGRFYSLAFC